MRSNVSHLSAFPLPSLRDHVHGVLRQSFLDAGKSPAAKHGRRYPRRLGLAISGGVDSMALASLCSSYRDLLSASEKECYQFNAFIVDHGVRTGSRAEALQVAQELRRLGIQPLVLNIGWNDDVRRDPQKVDHFESVARMLRYRAIGSACYHDSIDTLLVAHHADDQAETVLARMTQNYLGQGLKGIKFSAQIPQCEGMYGVDGSGSPSIPSYSPPSLPPSSTFAGISIESGGVRILRPFLSFTKNDLISVCRESKVKWFEDHTNADKTMTVRNTLRHLQGNGDFPEALSVQNVCAMAQSVSARQEKFEQEAHAIFNTLSIKLDVTTGSVTVVIPSTLHMPSSTPDDKNRAKYLLLRQLLYLVTPKRVISLKDLDLAVDHVSIAQRRGQRQEVQAAGVNIRSENENTFRMHRQQPSRRDLARSDAQPQHKSWSTSGESDDNGVIWSESCLWDNRYWISAGRIASRPDQPSKQPSNFSSAHFQLQFLTSGRLSQILKGLDDDIAPRTKSEQLILEELNNRLSVHAPGAIKYSLPVVVAPRITRPKTQQEIKRDPKIPRDHLFREDESDRSRPIRPACSGEATTEEGIVALPTFGWVHPKYAADWIFKVSYRAIGGFGEGENHEIVQSGDVGSHESTR